MKLLRDLRIVSTLALMLTFSNNSQAQCACTWVDAFGIYQCVLYPNCSGAFLNACGSQPNGSNFLCTGPGDCTVYPGSTPGCVPLCLSNGACWYNGNKCVAVSVCPTFLPIGLIELEGEERSGHNFITWKTAYETNNAYFLVERSSDLENWTVLVKLSGAGNSTNVLSYAVEDTAPMEGINYYKITQVDSDGAQESFGPISIDNSAEPRVLIKTVDLLGQEVDKYYTGFVFNCYSDGTTEKILR